MSIFARIREAIQGGRSDAGDARPTGPTAGHPAPGVIDIENNLDNMPGAGRLNWRTSIVDLLELLGIEADLASRTALAAELGRADYTGTTEDDLWLHRRVLREIDAHDGSAPVEIID